AHPKTSDNRLLSSAGQAQPKVGENPAAGGQPRVDTAVAQALEGYTSTIAGLLDVNAAIANGSDNERLLGVVATLDAFSRAKESADLDRAFMTRVFTAGRFGEGDYDRFLSVLSAAEFWAGRGAEAA